MTEDYFTMDDLEDAIWRYHVSSLTHPYLKLEPNEKETLLEKINSINKKLVVQVITPERVKREGTFTDKFTTGEGSSIHSRLPMDFIKENYVYYPTFLTNTLIVGIEVIILVGTSRGAVCHLIIESNGKTYLKIASIKDNGYSKYPNTNEGIYVLNLDNVHTSFINWRGVPWGDLK